MNKEEKERILKCVLKQIEKERTPRKNRHIKRTAIVALAAVMVFACGAFTVKILDLDSRLAALLGGTSDQIAEAVTVTDINAAVEKNGLRIEAKQAVGDGHRVYVLVELTSLSELNFDQTSSFEAYDVGMEDSFNGSGSLNLMNDAVSKDGKKLSMLMEVSSEEAVNEQDVCLRMRNFGRMTDIEEEKQQILIEGEWKLEFRLKYKDVSQSYQPKKRIVAGDGTLVINKVTISPISCFIEGSVAEYCDDIEEQWTNLRDIRVKMADGSTTAVITDGAMWLADGIRSTGTMEGTFGSLINMDQVESLLIENHEIPLK